MQRFLPLLVPLAFAPAGAAAEPSPQRQAWFSAPARATHPAEAVAIEALTRESDFSVFMRPDCPEPLKRRALRKLWSLLPSATEIGPATF